MLFIGKVGRKRKVINSAFGDIERAKRTLMQYRGVVVAGTALLCPNSPPKKPIVNSKKFESS